MGEIYRGNYLMNLAYLYIRARRLTSLIGVTLSFGLLYIYLVSFRRPFSRPCSNSIVYEGHVYSMETQDKQGQVLCRVHARRWVRNMLYFKSISVNTLN